jgi:hypothetical protein
MPGDRNATDALVGAAGAGRSLGATSERPPGRLLGFVQLDSEWRLDQAAADRWVRRGAIAPRGARGLPRRRRRPAAAPLELRWSVHARAELVDSGQPGAEHGARRERGAPQAAQRRSGRVASRVVERASRCPAAERRRNADADEQPAGDGRPEPGVVGRMGAVADRREDVKHEVAHQPPEPQRDRPRRLELPRKPRVGEGGDDGDCAERENALELEIHLHPYDQVVHEMGDRRRGGDDKDDPLGSHLP